MTNNKKIKDFTLYSFIILIIGLLLSTIVLFFFLKKVETLNNTLTNLSNTKNSFLELKMNTENLLSTLHLEDKKTIWISSIKNFDDHIKTITKEQRERIHKLWYISKKEIEQIKTILNEDILQPYNLHKRSILMLQGELFIQDVNSKLYKTILSLTRKIEFLLQYENFIFNEFKQMDRIDKKIIKEQIEQTKIYSVVFSLFILVIVIFTIFILNKKISNIENKLIKSQDDLYEKIQESQESKLLLDNIIDSIPIAIFWKNTNFKYLGGNKYFLNLAGLRVKQQIIGKTDFKLPWAPKDVLQYRKDDKHILKTGEKILQIEESILTHDKRRLDILTSKVPLTNTKGEIIGVLGIFMDITELKRINEELDQKNKMLEQQSKMAAMGEMLENIAHQWRQPLSSISTSASGIKVKKEFDILDNDFLDKAIIEITNSVDHLNQTIEDFRNYLKEDKELVSFNIDDSIQKVLFLIQSKIKNRDIKIIDNLPKIKIFGLKNEFIQVIMNILSNAIDALCDLNPKEKYIFFNLEVQKDKNIALLSITDNANGIDEKIIDKVFDAYFTTKNEEKGTGIGLYMSKEMITNHMNGTIEVENVNYTYNNTKYKGAKFTISLPIK